MTRSVLTSDLRVEVLIFVKDYLLQGRDRYFIYRRSAIEEVVPGELRAWDCALITHDYGMVARSIYAIAGGLPSRVIDLVEVHRATLGERIESKSSRNAMFELLADAGMSAGALAAYSDIFLGRSAPDMAIFIELAERITEVWAALSFRAKLLGELDRLLSVEIPVFNALWSQVVKGIPINVAVLREHKTNVERNYFSELKDFALKYAVPFELPDDISIRKRLSDAGLDTENTSLDYLLSFVQTGDNYGADLLHLKKTARSRSVLQDLSVSKVRSYPNLTISGTVTSRIIMRSPSLQNLARVHRNIVQADAGKNLGYVDFAQFEIGIMVALSGDPFMKELYETGDLYACASERMFGTKTLRAPAKRLFLSYSYGMAWPSLIDAAVEQGASRTLARDFFKSFGVFEDWKRDVQRTFQREGMVSTTLGNNLIRRSGGELTEKEKRSCVSQVVQGTASLIFKRSLLALSEIAELEVLIPMHDAVLYQSPRADAVQRVKEVFEAVFTEHFEGKTKAIAELARFH